MGATARIIGGHTERQDVGRLGERQHLGVVERRPRREARDQVCGA
jgi:hypothetical protein